MKNLVKITMSLVAVMLISTAVFAEGGTVSVRVLSGVEFVAGPSNITLDYDAFGTDANDTKTVNLTVNSNSTWTLSITAAANTAIDQFSLADIEVNGNALSDIDSTTPYEITGDAGASVAVTPLVWKIVKTEDDKTIPYGSYTIADITYTLTAAPNL